MNRCPKCRSSSFFFGLKGSEVIPDFFAHCQTCGFSAASSEGDRELLRMIQEKLAEIEGGSCG